MCLVPPVLADPVRIATWHVELMRRGPGQLLNDILSGDDPAVTAVARTIGQVAPDIILLTGIDWDLGQRALDAVAEQIAGYGVIYPYKFALRPNAGLQTGIDLDGDGRSGGPADAQGFGRFAGNGGMAILSRLEPDIQGVTDFTPMLWRDLPGALLPVVDGAPFPSETALERQRLSSVGHWDVPVRLPGGQMIHLLAFAAGPPVFDGPEDRNGKRNHDEIALWSLYLHGALDKPPPDAPVVVLGNANLDPEDGDGLKSAIGALLTDPRLQDPRPRSEGARAAALAHGGSNAGQTGDPGLDTADWDDTTGPGNLRISYVLPDKALAVAGAGVFWPPEPDAPSTAARIENAPRHHLVWVDIESPGQRFLDPATATR